MQLSGQVKPIFKTFLIMIHSLQVRICLYFTRYSCEPLHDCFFQSNFCFKEISRSLTIAFFPEDIFALKKYSFSGVLQKVVRNDCKKCHKIHRKIPAPESLLNKIVGLQPGTLLKKRLMRRCLPVNLPTIQKTAFFIEHL